MCQQSCVATTEGLAALCAQCITEHSGWYGTHCVNNCKTSFGPSGRGSINCSIPASCGASDEVCSGFEIGKASGSDCMAVCVQP